MRTWGYSPALSMRNVAAVTARFMDVPVVQIYTVEDYFQGLKPAMPVLV